MSRKNENSSTIKWHSPGSKGHSRQGKRLGTYARKHKSLKADRYDRPYLTGTYKMEAEAFPTNKNLSKSDIKGKRG